MIQTPQLSRKAFILHKRIGKTKTPQKGKAPKFEVLPHHGENQDLKPEKVGTDLGGKKRVRKQNFKSRTSGESKKRVLIKTENFILPNQDLLGG